MEKSCLFVSLLLVNYGGILCLLSKLCIVYCVLCFCLVNVSFLTKTVDACFVYVKIIRVSIFFWMLSCRAIRYLIIFIYNDSSIVYHRRWLFNQINLLGRATVILYCFGNRHAYLFCCWSLGRSFSPGDQWVQESWPVTYLIGGKGWTNHPKECISLMDFHLLLGYLFTHEDLE